MALPSPGKSLGLIGAAILAAASFAHAGADFQTKLVITSRKNGLESQKILPCRGTIHGYLTFSRPVSGAHTIEGLWRDPRGKAVEHSQDEIHFAPPGRRTAAVWLTFPSPGVRWNPLDTEEAAGDPTRQGRWSLEVLLDGRRIARSNFDVQCTQQEAPHDSQTQ
jgi:hypothetical protein